MVMMVIVRFLMNLQKNSLAENAWRAAERHEQDEQWPGWAFTLHSHKRLRYPRRSTREGMRSPGAAY
jgi:hypothetical protein